MIAIVTDSTAYLTHDEAARLNAVVVPMTYSVDGGLDYSEGCIEEGDEGERLVAENIDKMHTSQATLAAFLNAFTLLRRAGYEILCLPISSRLSGTYTNALLAAREIGGSHIEVVDSLTTCGGLYLLIREARALIERGLSLQEVAREICEMRGSVRTVFSVDDMTPLRRSGRLGNVKLSISTILNIKPLLKVADGSIVSAGVARGRIDQMKKLVQFAQGAQGTLVVQRFLADPAAAALAAQLEASGREVLSRRVGPVLGAHLGSGCIGLAWK